MQKIVFSKIICRNKSTLFLLQSKKKECSGKIHVQNHIVNIVSYSGKTNCKSHLADKFVLQSISFKKQSN